MTRTIGICILLLLALPAFAGSETFLEAPVIPGGTVLKKTKSRLETEVNLSHDQVVGFYKEALKGLKDIKFREWKDATYIEDDSNRPWHSITISKEGGQPTTVTIVKDNWTWIIGTLVLRYVGVFVVLMVLLLSMSLSGRIISKLVSRMEAKKAASG